MAEMMEKIIRESTVRSLAMAERGVSHAGLALTQDEEPHGHVHKDPGEAQELHQIVHEQVSSLQVVEV